MIYIYIVSPELSQIRHHILQKERRFIKKLHTSASKLKCGRVSEIHTYTFKEVDLSLDSVFFWKYIQQCNIMYESTNTFNKIEEGLGRGFYFIRDCQMMILENNMMVP